MRRDARGLADELVRLPRAESALDKGHETTEFREYPGMTYDLPARAPERSNRPVAAPGRGFDVYLYTFGREKSAFGRQRCPELHPSAEVQRWRTGPEHEPTKPQACRARSRQQVIA